MNDPLKAPAGLVLVGTASDDPFAIDLAYAMGQLEDIADIISLKVFANGEFCPRFIADEHDLDHIGHGLDGATVVIVSTASPTLSRQDLAMRTLLIARAARENGAAHVVLVEPDLFFSAQDRGPRPGLGRTRFERDAAELKKFDGQPFTAGLYAELLRTAGVDRIMTVHNQSAPVHHLYGELFEGRFHNLVPSELYADYLREADIVECGERGEGLVLCAPDAGARDFVLEMAGTLGLPEARTLLLHKERSGEREVAVCLHPESETALEDIAGRDVVLMDDMVRTGSTVVEACEFLRTAGPRRIVFGVSHFYASEEGRQKMASTALDEILTLNTLPTVLNRDVQGRLRRKMVVLKIERWLAHSLASVLGVTVPSEGSGLYQIDMSSKNPRFRRKIWSNDELPALNGR